MASTTETIAAREDGPASGLTLLSLSELVERTGVPRSTVHHYLKAELIPPPSHSAVNRFGYDERHVTSLRLIRVLRERRGLSLDEIAAELPVLLAQPAMMAELDLTDADSDVPCRLTDAAIELFQTRSFGEVTISDVAELAGVAKGSVYRHFSSKEELFTAAIEQVLARTATEFAGTVARLGGAEGVRRVPDETAVEFAGLVALGDADAPRARDASGQGARRQRGAGSTGPAHAGRGGPAVPLVTGGDEHGGDPIAAGLAVIQTAFSVMLEWAVGSDWPPDEAVEAGNDQAPTTSPSANPS